MSVLLTAVVVAVVDLLAQIRKDLPEVGHGVSPPAKWIFNGSGIFPELDEAKLRLAVGAAVGVGAAGGAAGTAGSYYIPQSDLSFFTELAERMKWPKTL